MFNLTFVEVALILVLSSGIFAGIYLAVRLARRPAPPNDGN
jgi:hypothetical protein